MTHRACCASVCVHSPSDDPSSSTFRYASVLAVTTPHRCRDGWLRTGAILAGLTFASNPQQSNFTFTRASATPPFSPGGVHSTTCARPVSRSDRSDTYVGSPARHRVGPGAGATNHVRGSSLVRGLGARSTSCGVGAS
eukprot:scaffold2858_cov659-Pavlova_lutheri.AAC.193